MKKDALILIAWVVLPPILLWLIHGNFFLSCILYLVLPSVYFSLQKPSLIPQALLVSTLAMPPMIIFDYLAFLNNAWAVPTIFPIRLFQFIPIEDFFFTFWAVYVVIVGFYYLFPRLIASHINVTNVKNATATIFGAFFLFLILYFFGTRFLFVPYYYLGLVIITFILPAGILFIRYPSYRTPLLLVILYSICLMLPYEIVANMLEFWTFPSKEYLGMIHLFGQNFPIEEFMAWVLLFPLSALAFNKFVINRWTN